MCLSETNQWALMRPPAHRLLFDDTGTQIGTLSDTERGCRSPSGPGRTLRVITLSAAIKRASFAACGLTNVAIWELTWPEHNYLGITQLVSQAELACPGYQLGAIIRYKTPQHGADLRPSSMEKKWAVVRNGVCLIIRQYSYLAVMFTR